MSSRGLKIVVVGFGFMAVALYAACALAQDVKYAATQEAEPAPMIGLDQPYAGYGTIDILDNGVLIIEAGGERWETEGEDGEIDFGIRASDSIGFQIDPKTYVVVERDGRTGIERVDSLAPLDRLAGTSVKVLTFADAEKAAANPTRRRAIFTISGQVTFRFDRKNQDIRLLAQSMEHPGQSFGLNARLGSAADAGGGEPDKMVGIRLYDLAYASSCTAVCDNGTSRSSMTCRDSAQCWCAGSTAFCRCTRVPS